MTYKQLFRILDEHVQKEAHETRNQGWEFDSLVFWNQVDMLEQQEGLDLKEAYDKVSKNYSFLCSSAEVIMAHEAFSVHEQDQNY